MASFLVQYGDHEFIKQSPSTPNSPNTNYPYYPDIPQPVGIQTHCKASWPGSQSLSWDPGPPLTLHVPSGHTFALSGPISSPAKWGQKKLQPTCSLRLSEGHEVMGIVVL